MTGEQIQLGYAGTPDETLRIDETDGNIICRAPLSAGNGPRTVVMWVAMLVLSYCIAYAVVWTIDVWRWPRVFRSTRTYLFGIAEHYFIIAKPIVFGLAMMAFLVACAMVLKRRRSVAGIVVLTLTPVELTLADPTQSKANIRWPRSEVRGFQLFARRRDLHSRRIADLQVILRDGRRVPLLRRVNEDELESLIVRLLRTQAATPVPPASTCERQ